MRKQVLFALTFHASALLLGFLLGTAAHQARHKSPTIIRFEPASQKLRHGTKSNATYSGRVV